VFFDFLVLEGATNRVFVEMARKEAIGLLTMS
jgi:hypothetical protein